MTPEKTNPAPAPAAPAEDPRVRRVELTISFVLRAGVLISLTLVVLGMALTFAGHPEYLRPGATYAALAGAGAVFPHTPAAVWAGLWTLSGPAVVMAGLLLLIATPVARVAVSVLAFVYQRDRTFVVITLIVLALLIASFILGKATA